MVYAQVKDGVVKNTLVLDDASIEHLFLVGFDYLIRVDILDPQPGPGWKYDGTNFSPGDDIL